MNKPKLRIPQAAEVPAAAPSSAPLEEMLAQQASLLSELTSQVAALQSTEEVVEESEGETKRAYLPMYRIIMWDDNVTTMEFVIRILITLMGKEYSAAEKLMYEIHLQGSATVATMPLEQAEFKVEQVHCAAAMEEFPFTCTIEQA